MIKIRSLSIQLCLLIFLSVLALSFIKTRPPVNNNGAIGDIKYSILELKDFQEQNGTGWLQLNGQAIQQNWDLYSNVLTKYKDAGTSNPYRSIMNNLPDARGIFLRAMNEGRDKGSGNSEGDLYVGTYQRDKLKRHSHKVTYNDLTYTYWTSGAGIVADRKDQANRAKLNIQIQPEGEDEGCPRNISAYVYIKVN